MVLCYCYACARKDISGLTYISLNYYLLTYLLTCIVKDIVFTLRHRPLTLRGLYTTRKEIKSGQLSTACPGLLVAERLVT